MVLVFAGAGASKAVNPKAYPTTLEFFDRLPDDIKNDHLFSYVQHHLEESQGTETLDIEQVLWSLGALDDFITSARASDQFPGWLLNGNRLGRVLGSNADFGILLNLLEQARKRSTDLTSRINELVYRYYRLIPTEVELRSTWLSLLPDLFNLDSRIEVFTTNYDLVIEQAIYSSNLPLRVGFSSGVIRRLEVELWDPAIPDATIRPGLLTKLHGSLDWIKDDEKDDILIGAPRFTGRHQQHAIIYPGFKGQPHEQPFASFHDHLRLIANEADAAIFIGFAFRDTFINDVLRDRLSANVPKVVIGFGPAPTIPFGGHTKYIDTGFSPESASLAIKYIRQRRQRVPVLKSPQD